MRDIPDYLKTERLFQDVLDRIQIWGSTYGFRNDTHAREHLERIFHMGRAVGRRSALEALRYPGELDDLRMFAAQVRNIADAADIPQLRDLVDGYDASSRVSVHEARYGWPDHLIEESLRIADNRDTPQT